MRAFLVVVLVVLVVGGVALAFYQDWFHLTVNKDKMTEDAEGAKENLQGLGDRIKGKAGPADEEDGGKHSAVKSARGKVQEVEVDDNRFRMTTAGGKELTMYMAPSSKLQIKDRVGKLEDLQVQDEVKVTYGVRDEKNVATSVVVSRSQAGERSRRVAD